MTVKRWLLCLLMLTAAARARDPFLSADNPLCQPAESPAGLWQLRGVIGREGYYSAWLVTPAGKLLRRERHDRLPGTGWYISQSERHGITLENRGECRSTVLLLIKGARYAKTALPLAGADHSDPR